MLQRHMKVHRPVEELRRDLLGVLADMSVDLPPLPPLPPPPSPVPPPLREPRREARVQPMRQELG